MNTRDGLYQAKRLLLRNITEKQAFDPYNTEINKPNLKEIKYYNYSIK